MTCIVGFIDKKKEKVYIGGDSAGVGGLDIRERKDVKVFKVGDFVIGCTSSFRMIQLIRFSFNPPKIHPDTDIYRYMCTEFVDALRQCFKNGGFAKATNGEESGGTFLVGYKDRLFEIEDDYQVAETFDGFDSCGCGSRYALGALNVLDDKLKPEEKVTKALETAVKFSAGVRPPFVIETTWKRSVELDRREIKKLVYEKYPITRGEAQCRNEKEMMRRVRENYRKKLLAQWIKEKPTM